MTNVRNGPLMHHAALIQQDKSIKARKDIRTWLMNRKQDGISPLGHLRQQSHDLASRIRIQTRCRFVQKQNGRMGDQFSANTDTSFITPEMPFLKDPPITGSQHVLKPNSSIIVLTNALICSSVVVLGMRCFGHAQF
jgi:hypothetical protein